MNKKKILITLGVIVFVFGLVVFAKTKASTGDNLSGWLWGGSEDSAIGGVVGTIDGNETGGGWINTNCNSFVDTDNNGSLDGALQVCNGGANDLKEFLIDKMRDTKTNGEFFDSMKR